MKKAIIPIVILCAIAVVIVYSCNKAYNPGNTIQSVNQVFSGIAPTPQNFSVTAGIDTKIYGANGTVLHFYPNTFKDGSGNAIPSGSTISLQLVEMYKPGDFICNRAATTGNGIMLKSGGEINLIATMAGGQEVFANGYGISFKQTTSSTQEMQLYYGSTANSDSITSWTVADTSKNDPPDSTGHGNTHHGTTTYGTTCGGFNDTCYNVFDTCVYFHWVNCDYILDTTHLPLTTVSVILPDNSYIPQGGGFGYNTEIYLILPVTNTIILLRGNYNKATNTVSLNDDGSQIPIGWNYEIAVIANKGGQYYYCQISGVTTSGLTVTAALAPDTQQDIKDRLAGL